MSSEPGPEAAPQAADDRIFRLLVGITIVATAYYAQAVLIPITLAVLLTFILAPLVALLRRIHLPRVVAVLLAVFLALGVILGIGAVAGSQLASLASGVPKYAATIETKVDAVRTMTFDKLSSLAAMVGRQASPDPAPPNPAAKSEPKDDTSPLNLAERFLSPVLSPIATIGIVLIVSIFMLMQLEDLRDRLIRLFGAADLHRTTGAMDDAGRRLSRYFLSQLAVNTSFGLICGTGLALIGVPNPVLWGLISAVMRFVPYIGSFIAAGLPLALAAAVEPGWSLVGYTAALYFVTEMVIGQVVEPLVYGRSTGLSPFAVIVSAILWSGLWGPIGLILAMPLTLCLVVLGRYVPSLAFLEILLGDKPALTPVESFYQRILASDADEALDHAETLLKTMTLADYYDTVALPGLRLAAADAERAVLRPAQLDRIRKAIRAVVDDLSPHAAPAEGTVPRPGLTLSIAGRGPLDAAAAAMLAQLLQQRGMASRVAPANAVGRDAPPPDAVGVTAVCVSSLELRGSPPQLRYLMRRLHGWLPGVPVLVGSWAEGEAALTDPSIRGSIGADQYTTTLAGVVDAVMALPEPAHTGLAA